MNLVRSLSAASMGPPHDGGGAWSVWTPTYTRGLASMGPPHDGGGEYAAALSSSLIPSLLQWGRLTMEAESCFRSANSKLGVYASMGPPHDGGGELVIASRRAASVGASMGPPHDGGGEPATDVRRPQARVGASMGPPHDGGGEKKNELSPSALMARLQWGRLTMEAESGRRVYWSVSTLRTASPSRLLA